MSAFELSDVTVAFAGDRGLHEVTLGAELGQVIALLGPSGAGKSTMLRVLAALQEPSRGAVTVLGTPTRGLWGAALRRLRRDVGLMMQHDNLVEGLRVFHNVAMGRLGHWSAARSLLTLAWPRSVDVDRVVGVLERVELVGRQWDWPAQLSGGERQRVALARLLLQSPRLWLVDEPAAGLDPRLRRELMAMLVSLVREQGATLVVTLHDVSLVDPSFDRVVGLRGGRVIFDLPPARLEGSRLSAIYGA